MAVALRRRGMLAEVEIIGSDLSEDAVDLARENAVAHAVADRVAVAVADLLPPPGRVAGLLVVPARFDVVCANLPYIPSRVVPGLPVAASFEPAGALDGGPDGLDVIRRLLDVLPERLAPDGVALLEIGSDQGGAIHAAVAEQLAGWDARVEPDLAGRPRVAVVTPPGSRDAPRRRATRVVIGRRIRLVALDLDGTLVGDDFRIRPRTVATIRAVVAAGRPRGAGHRAHDDLGASVRSRARAPGAADRPAGRPGPRDAGDGEPRLGRLLLHRPLAPGVARDALAWCAWRGPHAAHQPPRADGHPRR